MQYHVTTHITVDLDEGQPLDAVDAARRVRGDERIVVNSFELAVQILMALGLTRYKAQRRVRFARTGQLVLDI